MYLILSFVYSALFCSVFWDLYCAAPDRRETCEHSSEAKAFHDYVSSFFYPPWGWDKPEVYRLFTISSAVHLKLWIVITFVISDSMSTLTTYVLKIWPHRLRL